MPPLAVSELEQVVTELGMVVGTAVDRLVGRLERLFPAEARAFITDAYPEILDPFLKASGEVTAQWYAEQPVADTAPGAALFVPEPAPLPPATDLGRSGRWALTQPSPDAALRGNADRLVRNASRDTVTTNAAREGVRWVREAKPNACGFCRLMSIRALDSLTYSANDVADKLDAFGNPTGEKTVVVNSNRKRRKKARKPGQEYHDRCRCVAVPLRDGNYVAPDYIKQWQYDYANAVKDVGSKNVTAIVWHLDRDRQREDRPNLDPNREYKPVKKTDTSAPKPSDMKPKRTRPPEPKSTDSRADIARRLLPGLEANLAKLRAKGLPEDSPQITYHLEQIARLRADLAGAT